ncbi:hypothetical protein [Alteriqipengyuania lutimaris]|uniref:DUF2927 domain-containing protein n=1 Tax=Alteriqipengyuania lutimaris TaxID=1538146 RepID=A0A395LHB8_9SPHN|nr:hypothetical protein [Alteriqipengyuania lutimaris]MBB3035458.1 hypothetical protein [Alteriqipengyuania lutimaris]RDS76029.1 hypothetical protein DL238_15300 [Alteriqipengyuania lutimaris]
MPVGLWLLGVFTFSTATLAQEQGGRPTGDDAPTIIVEGQVQRGEDARELAEDILRPARGGEVMERFYQPLCPRVIGLQPDVAQVLADRILANAASAGIEPGDEGCTPNVLVAFVDDVAGDLEDLLENQPWAFGGLKRYQRSRVANEEGPTRAWHVTQIGDRHGKPREETLHTGIPVVRRPPNGGTLIKLPTTVLISASVVLIERNAIRGKSLRQIGDFASMRALLPVEETAQGATGPVATILSLFVLADAPEGLTEFDRTFLGTYYSDDRSGLRTGLAIEAIGREFGERLDEAAETED